MRFFLRVPVAVLIDGGVDIGAEAVGGEPEFFASSRRNCWASELAGIGQEYMKRIGSRTFWRGDV